MSGGGDFSSSVKRIVDLSVYGARFLKWARQEKLVSAVRQRGVLTVMTRMHFGAIHDMRNLAIALNTLRIREHDQGARCLANKVATSCNDVIVDILDVGDEELHCCLKVFNDENTEEVLTWARSDNINQDYHHDDEKPNGDHLITNNSVWSALMGKYDGKTNWRRPYSCFSCNDLPAVGNTFVCSRKRFDDFYKSTAVFPLRYKAEPHTNRFKTIGFMAFYSPKTNIFIGMPNIFDFRDDWSEYHNSLKKNAIFQFGACLADTLSTFLRPVYEKDIEREGGDANVFIHA